MWHQIPNHLTQFPPIVSLVPYFIASQNCLLILLMAQKASETEVLGLDLENYSVGPQDFLLEISPNVVLTI